jgi:CheY-like chemotaxis protein
MQTTISKERNKSLFVPIGLSVIGQLAGKWVPMRTESIDRTGFFIITKEYVKPRAVFDVLIWLGEQEAPISATVTASFVERTWDGYGIWAQISSVSTPVRQACKQGYSESFRVAQLLSPQRIVALAGALPGSVLENLGALGAIIDVAASAEQVYSLALGGNIDVVILAMADAQYDAVVLCQQLAMLPAAPRSLALIEGGTCDDFESALYGGAARIIARPCSSAMVVTRVLELLYTVKQERAEQAPPPPPRPPSRRPSRNLWQKLSGRVSAIWSEARVG